MSDYLCPICHDPSDHGLCDLCLRKLRRALADVIRIWSMLDELLEPVRSGSVKTKPTKLSPPAPADLSVIDARDIRTSAIVASVGGWARIVVEERRLSTAPTDVAEAARLLDQHAAWIADQPWCEEAFGEIRDAARDLRRIAHDTDPPPLGTCNSIDPMGEADRCGGPMDWREDQVSVVCRRCGDTWAEADLPHLLRVMDPKRKFPVPRAYVVIRYGVSPQQLRQWIRRGHVRTYHDEQVNLIDVLQYLGQTSA